MKKPTVRLVLICVAVCLMCLPVRHAVCRAETAAEFVRAMLSEVVAIQKDPALQGKESRDKRKGLIREVILRDFDFEDMAKGTLGEEQWKRMSKKQQADFSSVFRDLFIDSYSRLVLDFLKKEKFEYGPEETVQGRLVVKTVVSRLADRIPVNYALSNVRGRWLVKDVAIDGVSIVGNYRKAFSRIIRQESVNGLLKKMRLQQRATRE